MAQFTPIRYTDDYGKDNIPVVDGQMLVSKYDGSISFDIPDKDGTVRRVEQHYISGYIAHITADMWRYDNDLAKYAIQSIYSLLPPTICDDISTGYKGLAGIIPMNSRSNVSFSDVNGTITLITDTPVTMSALLLISQDSGTNAGQLYPENYSLFTLLHFEEEAGNYYSPATSPNLTGTTYQGFKSVYQLDNDSGIIKSSVTSVHPKFGTKCLEKIGSDYIRPIDSLNTSLNSYTTDGEFTIEWWQYDVDTGGCGGVPLWWPTLGVYLEMPILYASKQYRLGTWNHFAAVKLAASNDVSWYINGQLYGFSTFAEGSTYAVSPTDPEGSSSLIQISLAPNFRGAQTADGRDKNCFIDEFAIFDYAKYTENFDVSTTPYVGNTEAFLGLVKTEFRVQIDPGMESVGRTFTIPLQFNDPRIDHSKLTFSTGDNKAVSIVGYNTEEKILTVSYSSPAALGKANHIYINYPGAISAYVDFTPVAPDHTSGPILRVDIPGMDTVTFIKTDDGWEPTEYTSILSINGGHMQSKITGMYTEDDAEAETGLINSRKWSTYHNIFPTDITEDRTIITVDASGTGVAQFTVLPHSRYIINGDISTINIDRVIDSDYETELQFKTGTAGVNVNIPASVGVAGTLNFSPGCNYLVSFRNNIVVAVEYTPGVTM